MFSEKFNKNIAFLHNMQIVIDDKCVKLDSTGSLKWKMMLSKVAG